MPANAFVPASFIVAILMCFVISIAAYGQPSSSSVIPTLGQLSDAQAKKAREDWLKSKNIDTAPLSSNISAFDSLAKPVKPRAVYVVKSISGLANQLSAELSVNGVVSTVKAGDALSSGDFVQAISHDAVTIWLNLPPEVSTAKKSTLTVKSVRRIKDERPK
jgi:hypothetical protein